MTMCNIFLLKTPSDKMTLFPVGALPTVAMYDPSSSASSAQPL